jgi:hypothetical protein
LRKTKRWLRRDMPALYAFLAKIKNWRYVEPPLLSASQKRELIRTYAIQTGKRILIETGTYDGGTVDELYNDFDRLYSIELDDTLFKKAQAHMAEREKVTLLHGDSGALLPALIAGIGEGMIFWIDAHYAGVGFALGDKDTPVVEELRAIADHPVKDHAILIDDARSFRGRNDYPTIGELRTLCHTLFPQHGFEVKDDVIRIIKGELA